MGAVKNDFTKFLNLVRYRGDGPISIPLVNPDDGSEFDPAGHTLLFTLKASDLDLDAAALVQKISTVGGITVANPSVVTFVPVDYAELVANRSYEFDIQAQAASGVLRTVARGHLRFSYDITQEATLSISTTTTNPAAGYVPTSHAASHAAAGTDPLTLSKAQVGLSNVDNTSDVLKPVSTAQATADSAVASAAATAAAAADLIVANDALARALSLAPCPGIFGAAPEIKGRHSVAFAGAYGCSFRWRGIHYPFSPVFHRISTTASNEANIELDVGWQEGLGAFTITRLNTGSNTQVYKWVMPAGWSAANVGKGIDVVFVRPEDASVNWLLYVNGVSYGNPGAGTSSGTPPSFTADFTGTYLATKPNLAPSFAVQFFSCALTLADVLAIYLTSIPISSTQALFYASAPYLSDFSAGVDGWSLLSSRATATGNQDGISDGTVSKDDVLKITNSSSVSGSHGVRLAGKLGPNNALLYPIRLRYRLSYYIPAANTEVKGINVKAGVFTLFTGTVTGAWTTVTGVTDASSGIFLGNNVDVTNLNASGSSGYAAATTESLYFRDVRIEMVGPLVDWPLDDGLGFVLRDRSGNGIHGYIVGFTTPLHLLPRKDGRIPGKTSTNGNEALGTALALIPANSQILRIRARAQTGTPTVTLGSTSGGSQLVASVALSTTWKLLPIALADGIVTAATTLYVNSNSTDVIEWDIFWEPLSP